MNTSCIRMTVIICRMCSIVDVSYIYVANPSGCKCNSASDWFHYLLNYRQASLLCGVYNYERGRWCNAPGWCGSLTLVRVHLDQLLIIIFNRSRYVCVLLFLILITYSIIDSLLHQWSTTHVPRQSLVISGPLCMPLANLYPSRSLHHNFLVSFFSGLHPVFPEG